jgi:hypothetical protein
VSYDCSCDYDPPSWYSQRNVKAARKEHQCEECGCTIRIGEPYEDTCGMWDGYVSRFKTCLRCVALRQWARISVPCFCWAHGNLHDDVKTMVGEVRRQVPGFFFEYGRRMVKIERRARADIKERLRQKLSLPKGATDDGAAQVVA